ncbi:MAG: excinuclease ABC subunit UvrB [Kiritimatiellae bacterium]|nr:excinuclease ABC subunit UvrB [Kiritimatiellia bacterium]MDD5522300.1 excinuclease ABC subunit UvrB [Kiritimatiellia bacterium]
MNSSFKLKASFKPTGDQPGAIEALYAGLAGGQRFQVLEGVTGSGKTFTMANVIERLGRPTLVISHNKTLAAQLYGEFKSFFPDNAVEYFVSYYDYYQPEAYIPQTDTYIEKDASINKEIERLRLSATNSLLCRKDVIIVASVSCIYGLGSPEDYIGMLVQVEKGREYERDSILSRLVDIQYTRNDYEPEPGTFRVRGDTVDVFPSYSKKGIRMDFFGDEIGSIKQIDVLTGQTEATLEKAVISPAKHFVMPKDKIQPAIARILLELKDRVAWFEKENKLLEAQRIQQRTMYDIEMLKELGYCSGIENYSRHLSGRAEGEPPATLISYFEDEFLTIVDESHVTIPQLRGMYNGDRSRKVTLVEHGFRLPSALDNRPLNFDEFLKSVGQVVFTTATPGPFELEVGKKSVPQLIRPTGLIDPPVEVRPLKGQIDDLMEEVKAHAERGERVLVTTLTKRTAEDLSAYMRNAGLKVEYLHSDIDAIERVEVLRGLRMAKFDCVVGINLLREGLDLPEVALVAVLDADKEGFLRSATSLIQVAGRTARHINGKVILYADTITDSMRRMMDVTIRRRNVQMEYNKLHNITPKSVARSMDAELVVRRESEEIEKNVVRETGLEYDVFKTIREIEKEMLEAAEALEFERAAILRDELRELKTMTNEVNSRDRSLPKSTHQDSTRKKRGLHNIR